MIDACQNLIFKKVCIVLKRNKRNKSRSWLTSPVYLLFETVY